jgi:hypothetical protein
MTKDAATTRSGFDLAAALLADQPGAVQRILAVHHARWDGHCAGCFHVPPHWPCTLAAIARRALQIRTD